MKVFFALMVLLLGFIFQTQAQNDADVVWFENFFARKEINP